VAYLEVKILFSNTESQKHHIAVQHKTSESDAGSLEATIRGRYPETLVVCLNFTFPVLCLTNWPIPVS